ncbi:MAG: PD-(D/E)XK motif protein [Acidimicrobiia bacterium]|nr:PD-(D/E)XK motif protein [Acidimicrobiia bacterium]
MSAPPTVDRHQSWNEFQLLMHAGHPAIVTIPGRPDCQMFIDAGATRIGIRTPWKGAAPLSPMAEITVGTTLFQHAPHLEVSTSNRSLMREFYSFLCSIGDRIQLDAVPPDQAVRDSLRSWMRLLQQLTVLSVERQLGLVGELWMLRRLAGSQGFKSALTAWRGHLAEEHDFGLPSVDIEVKATVSERRVHVISSLTQLVPSPTRQLFLLSLQFTTGGGGNNSFGLPDFVPAIHAELPDPLRTAFDDRLIAYGWNPEHIAYYTKHLHLRSLPILLPIEPEGPAITPTVLHAAMPARSQRILEASYRIDLTDLGYPDGSQDFRAVLR